MAYGSGFLIPKHKAQELRSKQVKPVKQVIELSAREQAIVDKLDKIKKGLFALNFENNLLIFNVNYLDELHVWIGKATVPCFFRPNVERIACDMPSVTTFRRHFDVFFFHAKNLYPFFLMRINSAKMSVRTTM